MVISADIFVVLLRYFWSSIRNLIIIHVKQQSLTLIALNLDSQRTRSVRLYHVRTWLTEVQHFDWLVTIVLNSVDHAVEKYVLIAIDNDLDSVLEIFYLGDLATVI